jgi:hypothetical protein
VNRSYFALAALALASCVTAAGEDVWSVRQVIENQYELKGKVIRVRGWMDHCERLGCPLWDSPEEARRFREHDRSPRPGDEHALGFDLGLGGYPWFDREAEAIIPSYVVLTVRVSGRCMNDPAEGIIAACTDRGTSLVPIRIVRWGE